MKTKLIVCSLVLFLFVAFSDNNRSAQVVMVGSNTKVHKGERIVVNDSVLCAKLDSIAIYKDLMQRELNRTERMLKDAKYIAAIADQQRKRALFLEAKKEWSDISLDTIDPGELPVGIDEKELVKSIKEVKKKKE